HQVLIWLHLHLFLLCLPVLFFSTIRPPPTSTLFPYTTLFRSSHVAILATAHPTGNPSTASPASWEPGNSLPILLAHRGPKAVLQGLVLKAPWFLSHPY